MPTKPLIFSYFPIRIVVDKLPHLVSTKKSEGGPGSRSAQGRLGKGRDCRLCELEQTSVPRSVMDRRRSFEQRERPPSRPTPSQPPPPASIKSQAILPEIGRENAFASCADPREQQKRRLRNMRERRQTSWTKNREEALKNRRFSVKPERFERRKCPPSSSSRIATWENATGAPDPSTPVD